MTKTNRVDFACQSFAANRRVVERDLAELREFGSHLRGFRRVKMSTGTVVRILLYPFYLWEKGRVVPLLQEARFKIRFYRKIEADLEQGDLNSAIEALSLFAPREGTTVEIIKRVRTTPATISAIRRSSSIMRQNMLRLRDSLIEIQKEKAA